MHFPKSCEIWWSSLNSQSFMSLFSPFLCNLPLCVQSKLILKQHVLFSLPLHPITSVMYICSFAFPNRVNSWSTLNFKAPATHYYWIAKKTKTTLAFFDSICCRNFFLLWHKVILVWKRWSIFFQPTLSVWHSQYSLSPGSCVLVLGMFLPTWSETGNRNENGDRGTFEFFSWCLGGKMPQSPTWCWLIPTALVCISLSVSGPRNYYFFDMWWASGWALKSTVGWISLRDLQCCSEIGFGCAGPRLQLGSLLRNPMDSEPWELLCNGLFHSVTSSLVGYRQPLLDVLMFTMCSSDTCLFFLTFFT